MLGYRGSMLARLGLVVVMLIFAGLACSLGGDDDKGSDAQPTLPATITPPPGRTSIPTFTPFSSPTPFRTFAPVSTATRVAFFPVNTYTPIPVWSPPLASSATPYPYDVRLTYPVDGSQIAGYVTIVGSASHPRFMQYALEWGPDPNPSNLWYPITLPQARPIIGGGLGAINTTQNADGVYQIRLHVWLNDGTETFDVITGIHFSNTLPTAVPTLTSTPRLNHAPTINPIPSQTVDAGATTDISVTTSDSDNDTVTLFVAPSNNAIATTQVLNPSTIRVQGVTAGTAMITVTANDNHGGMTSTAFIVTVRGQNQAPTISPVLSQVLDVGQTLDVSLATSDPDGDTLTISVVSDDPTIATTSAPETNIIRLNGIGVGAANVTVTASDGKGGVINTTFQVAVGEPNRSPVIDSIPALAMSEGNTLDVYYTATDPDGDTLNAQAISDTESVVTAAVSAPGIITLNAIGAGPSTVTLAVDDGINPATITTFPVTVVLGNVPPTLDPLTPQTMVVNEVRDINYTALDPENDPLTTAINSDNPGVVTANINTPGTITLNAAGAGTATVTVTVNDSHNPAVSMSFTVSVADINLPPAIETISPQTLSAGSEIDVPYAANDSENDPLTTTVNSDNPGVVTASINTPGTITLSAVGAGTATVTLSVDDDNNPAVSMPFTVTVMTNAPPTLDPLGPQVMNMGDSLDVPYSASDPEGDPLTATATSDNPGVVTASINTPGTITLSAVGAGTATVTLNVEDGTNPAVSTPMSVTVNAAPTPNNPPVIQPLGPQVMNMGDNLDVPYSASDPEGDPLTATATSDNPGAVTASINTPGTITLSAVGAGTATVTLNVEDGTNPAVSTPMSVTVNVPNNPPVIQPLGPQVMNMGDSLDVPYSASDPEGDPLTATATSDNPGVVTASINTPGTITLSAVGAGTATVTLNVEDGTNPAVSTPMSVTVNAAPTPNNPPVIQPLGPQVMNMGDNLDVPYSASDPEGDPLTATATSDNPGAVTASINTPGTITLSAVGAGTATVTLNVEDGTNPAVSTPMSVTVNAPNNPPIIQPLGQQVLNVGDNLDVPYSASDPEGDPLTATATSDNPGAVTASINTPGTITLSAVGAGTATVTLNVEDGTNPAVSTPMSVTVNAPNNPPVIQPLGQQVLNVGDNLDVPYSASDPEGDPLTATATSDNPGAVTASINTPGTITLSAVGAGTATVTLNVEDGTNPAVSTPMSVTVNAPNNPPIIQPLGQQVLNVGDNLDVPYSASDPEGDPLTATATSDNPGAVTASINTPGTITLSAVGAGTATVTLNVEDGTNPAVSTPMSVTVNAPNNPPIIQPLGPQVMNMGDSLDVPYSASDPEGDPLTATATSDNPGVVTASINTPGTITLSAVGAGTATVTLNVEDGTNPAVSTPMSVTINAPNSNPIIQPIGAQTVNVGASLSVPVTASDPDGDSVTMMAVSDNPGVVTAAASSPTEVLIGGVTPGTATVTVDVNDNRGGVASISFLVTSVGVNNPPVIQPIAEQTLAVGEQLAVVISVSDPDGNPVVLTAITQNGGVVTAAAQGTDTVQLTGVGEGVTTVDVTADDAQGGVTTAAFTVSVSSAQPTFDLMNYPTLPTISPAMAQSLNQLYLSGVTNFGNQPGAFAKIGSSPMANPNFMVPFADGQYALGNYATLQSTIVFYLATPVRQDITINSFNVTSMAAGDYGVDTLSGPAGPGCQGGETLLTCELRETKPSIGLVSFDAASIIYMDPGVFRSELQSLVNTMLSNYGVIPVLATIPESGVANTQQLLPYNQAIVEVASQANVVGVPLWNVWRAMQEYGITDPVSVAPAGPDNFDAASLNSGYNVLNLTALQTLEAVRQAAGIN